MENLPKKLLCIFSFCISIIPLSSNAQTSVLQEVKINDQFLSQTNFTYLFDVRHLPTTYFLVELERNFAKSAPIEGFEFSYTNQRSLTVYQNLSFCNFYKFNYTPSRSAYTSLVQSGNLLRNNENKVNVFKSMHPVWTPHSEISKRQQTFNALLNIATSLYVNKAQQR